MPLRWAQLAEFEFDGLVLPGGHDKGMRDYLESEILQKEVVRYFDADKPVGAICHGVVLAARSKRINGKIVLAERKTTALLQSQEMMAYYMTCMWLKDYYRTYPQTVEKEVRSIGSNFASGPTPLLRDSPEHLERGFAVRDGNYVSARWPGDAHRFALEFLKLLKS